MNADTQAVPSRGTGPRARGWAARIGGLMLLALAGAIAILYWLGTREAPAVAASTDNFEDAALIERGAYLARLGNCAACHTARGGPPYAGGRAVPTPFGTLYGPNLTPDPETGIGRWSADDFWRALHEGKAPDGRLLYPAFPYPDYTRITRADADAIYAFLRSLPPVTRETPGHTLRFPYNQQLALAAWRALYFRPAVFSPEPGQDELWNRGAYLVGGLTHCAACHSPRNTLGATRTGAPMTGGMIPMLDWYAPPLTGNQPNGLGGWSEQDISRLLRDGVSARGTATGPMAEVVYESLQYLSDTDATAIARYLKSVPPSAEVDAQRAAAGAGRGTGAATLMARGAEVYTRHCADCHGARGEGRPPEYPPLAGNLSVLAPSTANAIRAVLNGGFAPGTRGNPHPWGMPPFRQSLSDDEVAAVVSYIRGSWGNQAAPVSPPDVRSFRSLPTHP